MFVIIGAFHTFTPNSFVKKRTINSSSNVGVKESKRKKIKLFLHLKSTERHKFVSILFQSMVEYPSPHLTEILSLLSHRIISHWNLDEVEESPTRKKSRKRANLRFIKFNFNFMSTSPSSMAIASHFILEYFISIIMDKKIWIKSFLYIFFCSRRGKRNKNVNMKNLHLKWEWEVLLRKFKSPLFFFKSILRHKKLSWFRFRFALNFKFFFMLFLRFI